MKFFKLVFEHHLVRFAVSGGSAFAVNFLILFLLTHVFHVYYIVSGIIAFLCAVTVSFILQKKWTFKDHSTEDTHKKFAVYTTVGLVNLGANTLFLYLFTDIFNFHYLVSVAISSVIIAVWSFFIYRIMFRVENRSILT